LKYAILDIETTGGSPKYEKITEIAVFIHDGRQITDEYSTLVNPEKLIPYHITNLTGISNEMVAKAPKFFEIARKLVEITEDCIIVGHNVAFDYGFIKNEFQQLGFDFHRKTLCTVKLARKVLPGFKSYSLGNICAQVGISINGRHRAEGDAFATVRLFELLLSASAGNDIFSAAVSPAPGKIKNINGFLKASQIDEVPAATGVYYLHDSEGNLLYIGKSKNMHQRVLSHLGNKNTRRSTELGERIGGISFEATGSELIALLWESEEIKRHKPFYNRLQKRVIYSWGLFEKTDEKGYKNLRILKIGKENQEPVSCFENLAEARKILGQMAEKYWLCQKLCGLYDTEGACFHYSIRQCGGACIGQESVKPYNERVDKLLNGFRYEHENMLIVDKGRKDGEKAVISIINGVYKGFGYIDITRSYLNMEDMLECIKPAADNRDVRQIIQQWMRRNKVEKVIRW